MSLLTPPPSPMRLKPLAWSILLTLSSPAALGEENAPGAQAPAPNMGAIEIELPAGFEDELSRPGTSQQGLQVLEALEVKGEWEDQTEKGENDVYRKDVSNVYVGKEDIERYKGTSVGDLFKGLNGVYSGESRNSGALDPNIRGIQGEGRIPVTVDGTEQSTSVWLGSAGVSNRNYVDPNMIGGISVEKGPSLTAGVKSGIGGSVEIRTLDAEDIVRPGETYGLELKSETASNSVAPNEDGMRSFGRDYRDIEGAYTGGTSVYFANGGGTRYTPHTDSRANDFDFEDNAYRIAAATRQDNFDLLGAYSYRKKGNYFSGKKGSKRYESESGYEGVTAENAPVVGDTSANYLASFYNPGGEVAGTSNEMRTTLLKGTLYLPDEQRIKLSYMHSDLEFGETIPYMINEVIKQVPSGSNFGFQLPYSEVKQDTFSINYSWSPEDNRWVDLQAGFWLTKSDSKRYQNGEQIYAINGIDGRGDAAWDNYVQCRYSLFGCNGDSAMPDKLANTDGRFNLFSRALQVTQHDRWGVTLGNKMQLTDSWMLTLSGDFSKEKLEQGNNLDQESGGVVAYAINYLGPRGGRREQYNFSFNNEWAATPWLTFTAGARYSDYNSFDTTLDENRKGQVEGWGVNSYQTIRDFGYVKLLSDEEAKNYEASVRDMVESWGLDNPAEIEEAVAGELANATVDGVYYGPVEVAQVPLKGTRLDSSANPFTNGSINFIEQVANAQGSGRTVARYLKAPSSGGVYQQIPEDERWAKPKKRRDSAWAPMAGVTLKLSDSARVYARYVEFIRFPTIYEDTQAFSGSRSSITSNQPSPEHAYNWEVGYVQDLLGFVPEWRNADFRINYYKSEIKDYIDRDFSYNIIQYEKKLLSGIELQTRFDTGKYFSSFGASYRLDQRLCDKDMASTVDPYYGRVKECVTGGFPTTFSRTSLQPHYSLNLDSGMRLFDERLEIGARMVYHSSAKNKEEAKWIKQNLDMVKGINQPYEWHPIWVFDTYATLHINKNIDVDFGVNNITNRYYLDPLARTVMPAPGRTLKMGLTARF